MTIPDTTATPDAEPERNADGQTATGGTDTAPEAGESHSGPENDGGNSEAAKYRRRLRDTETERDGLKQRVDTMQRAEVERLAGARLADAADVWRDGTQIADLLDDTGNIDPDKVAGALDAVLDAHPHWQLQKPTSAAAPASAVSGNGKVTGDDKVRGWSDLFRQAATGDDT